MSASSVLPAGPAVLTLPAVLCPVTRPQQPSCLWPGSTGSSRFSRSRPLGGPAESWLFGMLHSVAPPVALIHLKPAQVHMPIPPGVPPWPALEVESQAPECTSYTSAEAQVVSQPHHLLQPARSHCPATLIGHSHHPTGLSRACGSVRAHLALTAPLRDHGVSEEGQPGSKMWHNDVVRSISGVRFCFSIFISRLKHVQY